MATTTTALMITRARDLLQDPTGIRWSDAELLRWMNDAQSMIASLRPDLVSKTGVHSCASGSLQDLGAQGSGGTVSAPTRLLDVIKNADGRGVTQVDRKIMDTVENWHNAGADKTKHFVFDERTPTLFMVYPQAVTAALLTVSYSYTPADLTNAAAETIKVPDSCATAMLDLTMFKAYSKDSEFAGNAQRAQAYLASAMQFLVESAKVSASTSPKTSIPVGNK